MTTLPQPRLHPFVVFYGLTVCGNYTGNETERSATLHARAHVRRRGARQLPLRAAHDRAGPAVTGYHHGESYTAPCSRANVRGVKDNECFEVATKVMGISTMSGGVLRMLIR